MTDYLRTSLEILRRLDPSRPYDAKQADYSDIIEIPHPRDAEYQFFVSVFDTGPAVGAEFTSTSGKHYIWQMSFASYDYRSPDGQFAALEDCLRKLLFFPTRVTQESSLFKWRCSCEFLDGQWQVLSSDSSWKVFSSAPRIPNKSRVYHSPAVLHRSN
jgi:hypothetical protein